MEVEERPTELIVSVPAFRHDISIEEDLIEEIARLYGYNNIEKRIPLHTSSTLPSSPLFLFEARMRKRLMGEGLQEVLNCDLISPAQENMLMENAHPQTAPISVLYAKSAEQSVLRSSLLPGLLQMIKYNCDHSQKDIATFEIGRIYFREGAQFKEQAMCAIALSGKCAPYHWDPKPAEFDFFDLKGVVENVFSGFKLPDVHFAPSHVHNFHPGRQAYVKIGEAVVGILGEVHLSYIEALDIGQRVLFAECNLHALLSCVPIGLAVVDSPLYPGSERDWTITLKDEVPIGNLFVAIHAASSPLLERVILLDLYKSAQIGKDKKNATFRFFYRDVEKTLAFETVEREHARIISTLQHFLN
jgi:phenylalanyl-tRNA synthetase beta chain